VVERINVREERNGNGRWCMNMAEKKMKGVYYSLLVLSALEYTMNN